MNPFDKAQVPTAVAPRHKFPVSCDHTTTSDFFQLNVPYIRRMIPKETIKIDINAFARLNGMPLPTFGRADLNLRAFFVPYNFVMNGWRDFKEDLVHTWLDGSTPSIPTYIPRFTNIGIVSTLIKYSDIVGWQNVSQYEELTLEDLVDEDINIKFDSSVPFYGNAYILIEDSDHYTYQLHFTEDGDLRTDEDLVGSFTFVSDPIDPTYNVLTISSILSDFTGYTIREFVVNYYPKTSFDYIYNDTTLGVEPHYKFQPTGKLYYKILRQLGYGPQFTDKSGNWDYHSALALLCLLRIFLDYYYPAQYVNSATYKGLESTFFADTPNIVFGASDFESLMSFCARVFYGSDYFTAAFDEPSGPATISSEIVIDDPTFNDSSLDTSRSRIVSFSSTVTNNNTPYIDSDNGVDSTAPAITQFAISALRKVSDYLKRNQLAGARAIDRFMARWGLKIDNQEVKRPYYIGSYKVPLVVRDIMSTADTAGKDSGAALGDYAGQGFLLNQKNGHFEFTAPNCEGIFMICSSIVPKVSYYQGYDLHNFKLTKLDFFTNEFDGMGNRAQEKGECFSPMNGNINGYQTVRGARGFVPIYSEYKIPYDRLTGDFNYNTMSAAGFTSDAWHLFRELDYSTMNNVVHSLSFVEARDSEQYNRIFYNTSSKADHFVINYIFNVDVDMNAKPIYDSYDFEHDSGQKVDIAVNGQRVN